MQFTNAIVFALGLFSVQALPLASPEPAALEARALPAAFAAHALNAIRQFGPAVTKTMMHSGVGASNAFKIAQSKGLQTVETTIFKAIMADKTGMYDQTLKKYCVPKDQFCADPNNSLADWKAAWKIISRNWAGFAQVRTELATTKQGPKVDSFYKEDEEPVLEQNHVTIDVDNNH